MRPTRFAFAVVFALAALLVARPAAARAAAPVDAAMVLAADVSRSIDDEEFALQRKGYAAAMVKATS